MPNLAIIPTGMLIGILVSAPVGPVNLVCINRSLRFGFGAGLTVGSGAAIADGLLAMFAGFGIAGLSDVVANHDWAVQLVGGVILVAFGLGVSFSAPPRDSDKQLEQKPPFRTAIATFFITITNPGAILGMLAIFGGVLGTPLVPEGDYLATGLLVLSVMGGALLWWTGLAALVARVRHRFSPRTFRIVNLVSGMLLVIFGVAVLANVAFVAWNGG